MKDVHIGPFPPPLGGISVYLYRLSRLKKKSLFIDTKNIMGSKRFRIWLIKQIFNLKRKNFIYHSNQLKVRLIFFLLSCITIHKFSLVIHGQSLIDQYNKPNNFIRFLMRRMLNKAKFIQVVNPRFKDFIKRIGIKNKNIIVKHAFLPPPLEDFERIFNSYNEELIKFLKNRKPIIIANAYSIKFYDNVDLYGLDMCIELIKKLKKDFPKIGFIFALANEKSNLLYIEKMKEIIIKDKIEENFYFLTGQKELWPIFKFADLMVRPTYIDSFGISIAEALYLNCPAIASDVCPRAEGTILFENRNFEDLYKKAKEILVKTCEQ